MSRKKNTVNSLVTLTDQGVVSLGNFLSFVIIAKLVAPIDLAMYTLLLVSIVFFGAVQNALFGEPIRILSAGIGVSELQNYISSNTNFQLLFGLSAAILIVVLFSLDARYSGLSFSLSLGFFTFTYLSAQFMRSVYFSQMRFGRLLGIDVAINLIRLLLLAVILIYQVSDIHIALMIISATNLLSFFVYVRDFVISEDPATKRFDYKGTLCKHWAMGKWIILEAMAFFASTQVFVFYLNYFGSVEDVAVYGALNNLLNSTNVILAGLSAYAASSASSLLINSGLNSWRSFIRGMTIFSAFLVGTLLIILSVFSEGVLTLVYSEYYASYYWLLPIFAIGFFLAGINSMLRLSYLSGRDARTPSLTRMLAGVVGLIVATPLVAYYGLVGAIIAFVLTQSVWFFLLVGAHNSFLDQLRATKDVSRNLSPDLA